MDDMLTHPRCTPADLGRPMPDSIHAVSVCLPLWRHNIGYEEADCEVVDKMKCGYPRFFLHPQVVELFAECERKFARGDECCFAFPSEAAARRCADFVRRLTGEWGSVHEFGVDGIHAICVPKTARDAAKSFWQHTGEIVSSRQAVAAMQGKRPVGAPSAVELKRQLRERVARLAGATTDDVLLFPNGMAAVYCAYRAIERVWPGRKCVQFGFPYVDTLKVLEKFGAGMHFFPRGDSPELDSLEELLARERIAALYCEFPGNPLLTCPDLGRLRRISERHKFPLVVDDTLSACINTDLLPASDVLVSSLTKFFSGTGDVMGGSLVLNRNGAFYERLKTALVHEFEDLVYSEDAAVLERNSRDVVERVSRINESAEQLCDWIRRHPAVERVHYPKYSTPDNYRAYLRKGGGYGGLFSIDLKNAAVNAPRVYDALGISKGPNLGTNFSICCPYTILAHYGELDFVESCGVSRYLLRVSVGLEDADWLKGRFDEALADSGT